MWLTAIRLLHWNMLTPCLKDIKPRLTEFYRNPLRKCNGGTRPAQDRVEASVHEPSPSLVGTSQHEEPVTVSELVVARKALPQCPGNNVSTENSAPVAPDAILYCLKFFKTVMTTNLALLNSRLLRLCGAEILRLPHKTQLQARQSLRVIL